MVSLDVGCGYYFKGEVNIDLFFSKKIVDREKEQNVYLNFKRKIVKIPNFVCADSNFLPFRKKVFEMVICNHLLEHKGVSLIGTVKELLRVCKNKLVITVPSEFSNTKYAQKHGSFLHDKIFTPYSFHILFRNYNRRVNYNRYVWDYVTLPNRILRFILRHLPKWFPCFIPTEIYVEIELFSK